MVSPVGTMIICHENMADRCLSLTWLPRRQLPHKTAAAAATATSESTTFTTVAATGTAYYCNDRGRTVYSCYNGNSHNRSSSTNNDSKSSFTNTTAEAAVAAVATAGTALATAGWTAPPPHNTSAPHLGRWSRRYQVFTLGIWLHDHLGRGFEAQGRTLSMWRSIEAAGSISSFMVETSRLRVDYPSSGSKHRGPGSNTLLLGRSHGSNTPTFPVERRTAGILLSRLSHLELAHIRSWIGLRQPWRRPRTLK